MAAFELATRSAHVSTEKEIEKTNSFNDFFHEEWAFPEKIRNSPIEDINGKIPKMWSKNLWNSKAVCQNSKEKRRFPVRVSATKWEISRN